LRLAQGLCRVGLGLLESRLTLIGLGIV
jgi:hypothetical protein